MTIQRSAEMRYGEQIFEIDVPLDGLDMDDPALAAQIEERFHRRHEDLYTYASPDQEVVFVNARVAAVGAVTRGGEGVKPSPAATPPQPKSTRKAFFGAWREVPVYAMEGLAPGHTLAGPAIVEAETTTVVLNDSDRASVNDLGWLDIRLA
jgi:N-methylhydantoinase A